MTFDRLREDFRDPPLAEYGNVPFWWWDGDRLSEARITEQLESLSETGVRAVCFEQKYPHGPPEGPHVPYFSEEWWAYMEHAAAECDRLDMHLWIHDETYHHSPPSWKRYWQDRVEDEIDDRPEFQGRVLDRVAVDVAGGEDVSLSFPDGFEPVSVAAYPRVDGQLLLDDAVPIDHGDGAATWTAPDGEWHVAAVGTRPHGLRRTSRDVVDRIMDLHYGEYVERLGDYLGTSIVGTFQDELYMLQGTVPCDGSLLDRFRAEWERDPEDELIALFEDCGPRTPAIRTQYADVVTTVLEENWFEPLYEWHERRGLKFAHDNWGRNDLTEHATEYGDYVRTHRWFQEPGYDDGRGDPTSVGSRNFFDGKVAASIAACYGRERVWGELFHTTGWGYPPELQFACIAENACYGLTRYNMHGLYYSTLGGWYEHAPPDAHFRQPYWEHLEGFNEAVARLMYLFSQGDAVVDLAMLYPLASIQSHRLLSGVPEQNAPGGRHPVEFEPEGEEIDERTRAIAEDLFDGVADLLFVDHETVADGTVANGRLAVAGIEMPAFVLGPLSTVRREVLETAVELVADGGVVISIGRLPTATVEAGEDDEHLDALLSRLFGDGYDREPATEPAVTDHESGGAGIRVDDVAALDGVFEEFVDPDVVAPNDVYHAHRRVGDRDIYLLLNTREAARSIEVALRTSGVPARWDVLTGEVETIHAYDRDGDYTTLELDVAPHEFHVVVVDRSRTASDRVVDTTLSTVDSIDASADAVTVRGVTATSGRQTVRATVGGETIECETGPVAVPDPIDLSGDWSFEPESTLDNRRGDFRYPPAEEVLGVEVRTVEYRMERANEDGLALGWTEPDVDTNDWRDVTPTYGQYFWRRGTAAGIDEIATPDEDRREWEPYVFSEAVGTPGTHPDDHGHNGVIGDDFIAAPAGEPSHFWTTVAVDEGTTVACHHGDGIADLRVGDERIAVDGAGTSEVSLPAGTSTVHVVVEPDTDTHVAFEPVPATASDRDMAYVPRLRWFHETETLSFDRRPRDDGPIGWYRFELPVGTASFELPWRTDRRVWVDGLERSCDGDRVSLDEPAETPTTTVVRVQHDDARYGGAALTDPIAIETEPVSVDAGDWRALGLESFSGIGVYRKSIDVPPFDGDDRIVLDLGEVAVTASVSANGHHVGTVHARPFEVDLTDAVEPGENRIEVRVANTIANHFETETPTRYVYEGQTRSGLVGPVTLRVRRGVRFDA